MDDFGFDNEKTDVTNNINNGIVIEDMQPDEVYQLTQSVRKAMVTKMTRHTVPTDAEEGKLLLDILDSMDKQVLAKSKLKIEEQQAKSDDEVKAVLAAILKDRDTLKQIETPHTHGEVVFSIPEDLPQPDYVPGITDVNPAQIEYAQIMDEEKSSD